MAGKENESPNFDKGLIQAAIGKNSEIQLVKGVKLELKGGDKIDSRILVITGFRFFIITANKAHYKVDLSVHILDIHAIESKKPEQIVIQYGEKNVKFCLIKSGTVHFVIGQLISNLKTNFPGGNLDESVRKDVEPSEKLENINNVVNKLTSSESLTEAGPCGGFSHSYACICDHMGVPFVEEVAWDVDTIYLSNDTKEFKIQDFDHLEPRELIPVIATLEYNVWFTKLVCASYKLSAEILDVIARVVKRSTTIVEIVLDGVSLGREFCQKLATALTSNPKSALEKIDLSRNPSAEDRGIIHLVGGFSKLSHGLDSLNLHDTGITSKGASTIGQMIKSSKYMSTSLTSLNLSNNPIKADGVTAICDFLAQANALTHIDLSSTECFVENIFGALIRGCCQNLIHLNMSGNQFTNRKSKDSNLSSSFQQFFTSTAALKEVKMSECRLPADAARAILLGLIDNIVVKDVTVDISKNELKTAGLRAIAGPLSQIGNLYSLDLSDNGFESDLIPLCESLCENKALKKLYVGQNFHKGRNLNNIMETLIKLISVENSPIEFLSLAESRLKQSITLLFDSLGTNESLVELDISGNQMGDEGARVLAKALQINSKLRTIHWDRNSVTQNGLRDIALALENNLTLQSMPIPIYDVSMCLKPATEKALKQIEKCLSRNHSPSQAVTEQAYRLQQGLMMTSTQQQMVDKLIVQLQDTSRTLRGSADENVKSGLRNALRCINDADKLKQLFLKFHMSVSSKNVEERLSSLASDIYNSIQQQMRENVEEILECAESNCPFVTEQQGVKESLKTACEGKANVNKAFIDTVLLQQLAPVILNKVSETNLNLSTIVVDTLMDEVITQLEQQQSKLDLLVKEHKKQAEPVEEKPTEIEEHNDNLSEAAQKAKNRLSAACNRRSVRFSDDENDVFASSGHGPRRRPTINRKRRTSGATEDHADSGAREETKKKEPVVTDIDLSATGDTAPKELVHVTKNRPRPARGRRPPTRASGAGGQQNSVVGPEIVVDNFDDGIDSFFSKPAVRPHSAALPETTKLVAEPPLSKSATMSQRSQSTRTKHTKHEKEEAEESQKEPHEKKKLGGILGMFKKKTDKKSQSAPRKESKKDHKKSREDLTDAGIPQEKKPDPKPVEASSKPVEEIRDKPEKTEKPEKPEKQPKRPPLRPQKPPEKHVPSEAEKPAEPDTKVEMKSETNPETSEPDEASKEKAEGQEEKDKGDDGKQEGEEKEHVEPAKEENDPAKEEPPEKPKPQPKGPPKFGVGLPMGPMGGDLLAEMKKRNERSNSTGKKSSPEPKPRARVGTTPELHRPVVPARPTSIKRPLKAKSAADLHSVAQDGKPTPQPRHKEGEGERKRHSNEASKPVPPKPAPKEKPQVGQRPTVPKRPPSVSRSRGNSQKEDTDKRKSLEAEKRKSVEAETVPEHKSEEKTPEKPVVKDEGDESKEKADKGGDQASDEPTEKPQPSPEKDTDDKGPTEEAPEKHDTDEKVSVDQKPENKTPEASPEKDTSVTPEKDTSITTEKDTSITPEKDTSITPEKDTSITPEKDTSITPEKDTSQEETAETASDDKDAPEAPVPNATKPSIEEDVTSETETQKIISDDTSSSNETSERPKDTNDNETDVTEASEDSTTKVEPATTEAESDDVIKSSVDKDLLEEALTSAKDTLF